VRCRWGTGRANGWEFRLGHRSMIKDTTILILHADDLTAYALAARIIEAGGDVVLASTATEGLERLDAYSFDAAILETCDGVERVVEELEAQDVPFCLFGTPTIDSLPEGQPLIVSEVAFVVPALVTLLHPVPPAAPTLRAARTRR
jgi:hypothetical protein